MGYNTDFTGHISVTPPLNEHEIAYLDDFAQTRHTSTENGPLVVDASGNPSIPGNTPQWGKPAIWCNWLAGGPFEDTVDPDGRSLVWSGSEKTYGHDRWLIWIIKHLLGPTAKDFVAEHAEDDPRLAHFTCDHILDGEVYAQGDDVEDVWRIKVVANDVTTETGVLVYPSDQDNNPSDDEGRGAIAEQRRHSALDQWVRQVVASLTTDKSNDWSEEIELLRQIDPDLLENDV